MSGREKIEEQLSAYLDGELPKAEREEIERALQADPKLAEQLRQLQAVRDMLKGLPREHSGEEFVSGVLARAERRDLVSSGVEHRPLRRLSWARWLASAAVLLIAVGIGMVVTAVLRSPTFPEIIAEKDRPDQTGQIAREVSELAEKPVRPDSETATLEAAEEGRIAEDRAEEIAVPAKPAEGPPPPVAARGIDLAKVAAEKPVEQAKPTAAAPLPAIAKAAAADHRFMGKGYVTAGTETHAKAAATAPAGSQDRATVAEAELADARNEVIFTDNVAETQRQVEKLLTDNNVVPLEIESAVTTNTLRISRQRMNNVANYVQLITPAPGQVQLNAFVTPVQMANLTKELNHIRLKQHVSQATPRDEKELPVADEIATASEKITTEVKGAEQTAQPVAASRAWVAVEQTADGRLRLKEDAQAGQLSAAQITAEQAEPPTSAPLALQKHHPPEQQRSPAQFAFASQVDTANIQPLLITLNLRLPVEAEAVKEVEKATQEAVGQSAPRLRPTPNGQPPK